MTLSGQVAVLTPSPQDYIQFECGDVLGFYVDYVSNSNNEGSLEGGVAVLTSPNSFTSELVWYASIAPTMTTSQNGVSLYSVGSNGDLDTSTHAAPVISIEISK